MSISTEGSYKLTVGSSDRVVEQVISRIPTLVSVREVILTHSTTTHQNIIKLPKVPIIQRKKGQILQKIHDLPLATPNIPIFNAYAP